jgi:hypothetical protein
MAATTSLPTVFERFTALSREHERLDVTLRHFRELCESLASERAAPGPDARPLVAIADLLADLSQHFAAEERDAYFGTIVLEQPSLLPRVAVLKAEHGAMLRTIAELGAIAADDHRRSELSAPALRLIARFQAHEHAENELLQEYFLRDEGASPD